MPLKGLRRKYAAMKYDGWYLKNYLGLLCD